MLDESDEGADWFYQGTDVNANAVASMARFVVDIGPSVQFMAPSLGCGRFM